MKRNLVKSITDDVQLLIHRRALMQHRIISTFWYTVTARRSRVPLQWVLVKHKVSIGHLRALFKESESFFGQRLCTEGLSGFRVFQKQRWCPCSLFAVFCSNQFSFTSIYGEVFLKTFKKALISNSDLRRHFPKRSPVLRSKTLSQFVWGYVEKKQREPRVCAYCMKHTQRDGDCV